MLILFTLKGLFPQQTPLKKKKLNRQLVDNGVVVFLSLFIWALNAALSLLLILSIIFGGIAVLGILLAYAHLYINFFKS